MLETRLEAPSDGAEIELLLDRAFGAERRDAKTVYRLREHVAPLTELCFVVRDRDALAATLRFWPVTIGAARPALLLGPIAVAEARRGAGVGARLMGHGLARARTLGHGAVLLVGDAAYYGRFGFRREHAARLSLPGPFDPARFLGAELVPGALAGAAGPVRAGACLRAPRLAA